MQSSALQFCSEPGLHASFLIQTPEDATVALIYWHNAYASDCLLTVQITAVHSDL